MKVFTDFDEKTAHLLRVWVRSWEKQGWTPRLIFQRSVDPGTSLKVTPQVINFSYRGRTKRRTICFGSPGWRKAPLVRFPDNVTEEQILSCGRPL